LFLSAPRYAKLHVTLWAGTCANFVSLQQCRKLAPVQEEFMKIEPKKPRAKADFEKDRRRKHHHYLVTVHYEDGEKFGRVYTDKDKATRFAERQRRSPVVKAARISQVS
jgi:hypothetical protein